MRGNALRNNIIDVIKEEQMKLGYCRESIRLYYPLESLNHFFHGTYGIEEMYRLLEDFSRENEAVLGKLAISNKGERFCLRIPEEGGAYVHENVPDHELVRELIGIVSRHGISREEILEIFKKQGGEVCCEETGEREFLVYFKDGIPDSYYYIFTQDGHHTIYHRFLKEDYYDLYPERRGKEES